MEVINLDLMIAPTYREPNAMVAGVPFCGIIARFCGLMRHSQSDKTILRRLTPSMSFTTERAVGSVPWRSRPWSGTAMKTPRGISKTCRSASPTILTIPPEEIGNHRRYYS
ncbi:hypothetical protein PISMIDRAFT_677120 [Pisolithus microcarpus 441]|uniref:Uncharacterized protein n=1 Tax=Pisolithus microcarpus 441 TaxID=765257 RepID=A0A0C9ZTE7_9AGAM|nr:hypothetical protein PISMIDRAFT_677120 [Pisolithus microcarpus 441]